MKSNRDGSAEGTKILRARSISTPFTVCDFENDVPLKRKTLIDAGRPREALLITAACDEKDEGREDRRGKVLSTTRTGTKRRGSRRKHRVVECQFSR
jgi:hypothetical protein